MNKVRACFVCETQYHLMNAINFVLNQKDFKNTSFDVFLRNEQCLPDSLVKRLGEKNLFNKIYRYSYRNSDDEAHVQGCIKKNIIRVRNLFWPQTVIQKSLIVSSTISKYDTLFFAYPTPMTLWLVRANRHARIYFYEDGAGSYINGMDLQQIIRKENMRFRLMLSDNPWKRIVGLYVYNPSLCKASIADNILRLPVLSEDRKTLDLLKDVFSYKETNLYKQHRIVFLSQPSDNIWDRQEMERLNNEIVRKLCEKYKEQIIVRYHPRDINVIDSKVCCDGINNMWELICAEDIDDNAILISLLSTAQMTPKLIYDKEPNVIFTFRIYQSIQKKDIRFDALANTFINKYHSTKIDIAYDIDSIINIVDRIMAK